MLPSSFITETIEDNQVNLSFILFVIRGKLTPRVTVVPILQ